MVTYPRRGTFATGVDISELAYVSEIRVRLEPLAARRADRGRLAGLADDLERSDVSTLSRHELMQWDLRVHRTLYRGAGDPHLADTLVRYHNPVTRIFCLFLDRFDRHIDEHVGLLRAAAAGDGDGAVRAARDHVAGFEKAIRAVI